MQRQMVMGIGLVVIAGAPLRASAQYGYGRPRNQPLVDTPKLMVGTCHSSPRQLGVDAAKELRDRIQNENNVRDLYVIPNKDVNTALTASGYAPDSALSLSDMGALGKLVHADEILDCDASRTPSGVHLDARMLLATDVTQTQPLPPVDAKDWGEAAKAMERENTAARKQFDGYTKCRNELRDGKPMDAIRDAREAIKAYEQSTLARICLANAFTDKSVNYPPDSVLAVTDQIMRIDPQNVYALRLAIGAYDGKGDKAKETDAMLKLYQLQPQDQSLALRIVNELAASPDTSSATKALIIVDDMLKQNPGDPTVLQQKWKLLAKLGRYQDAMAVGEQMVRSDTSLADTSFFSRQIAMASTDSNWAKVVEYAGAATKKFASNEQFAFLDGVALTKLNQFQPAADAFRHALTINPKNTDAQLYLANAFTQLGQADSALSVADAAIAAGGDKTKWGPLLLGPVPALLQQAKTDSANAAQYYRRAYAISIHADSVAPSATAHFFIGVTAVQLAFESMRTAQAAAQGKQMGEACRDAKQAQDYFTDVQTHMQAGGAVDPNTAGSVMNAAMQYSTNADQMVKAYCKK